MASITIRRLDDSVKLRLRVRAARNGRSMEEEAREILKDVLAESESRGLSLSRSIRRHIEPLGGIELIVPSREPVRDPPKLGR